MSAGLVAINYWESPIADACEPVPEWAREQLAAQTARLVGRALGRG